MQALGRAKTAGEVEGLLERLRKNETAVSSVEIDWGVGELRKEGLERRAAQLREAIRALIHNTSVIQCRLVNAGEVSNGADIGKDAGQLMVKNKTLRSLDLSGCRLGEMGIKEVAESLRYNHILRQLRLVECGATAKSLGVFRSALIEMNLTLMVLELGGVYMPAPH